MRYKIEIIHTVIPAEFILTEDSERVPVYCLYKRGCSLDKWQVVAQSTNLDNLIKLAKTLKEFQTIYL